MRRGDCYSLFLILLCTLGMRGSVLAQDHQNWKRLETMPLEQRQSLARNLDELDLLPPEQQSAIRSIDAEIAKLDPATQARYRAVMRRYHIWLEGLSQQQKSQLEKEVSLESKLALIEKWRKAERLSNSPGKGNLVLGVHPGDLGMVAPFEMANALRVWIALDPPERARIESITPVRKRIEELIKTGRTMKQITFKRFLPAEEEAMRKRLEAIDQAKQLFPLILAKKVEVKTDVKKTETKAETKKAQPGIRDGVHHIAESLYFMDHPPAPVSREHLAEFEAELPGWFRASLDPLTAEDARRRLTMLYRQIYEPPAEIKPMKKAAPAKPAAKPKPAATKPATPVVPL